ncbi:hypothetical protein CCR85_05405 [Rhodothalassium salexigens]|nr:hypothetical protein [Rhodothalassium salexigens]
MDDRRANRGVPRADRWPLGPLCCRGCAPGFAIGGVAPIGHLAPIETWMDRRLLAHHTIWVAAGAPDAVFAVRPDTLRRVIDARLFDAPVDG